MKALISLHLSSVGLSMPILSVNVHYILHCNILSTGEGLVQAVEMHKPSQFHCLPYGACSPIKDKS